MFEFFELFQTNQNHQMSNPACRTIFVRVGGNDQVKLVDYLAPLEHAKGLKPTKNHAHAHTHAQENVNNVFFYLRAQQNCKQHVF